MNFERPSIEQDALDQEVVDHAIQAAIAVASGLAIEESEDGAEGVKSDLCSVLAKSISRRLGIGVFFDEPVDDGRFLFTYRDPHEREDEKWLEMSLRYQLDIHRGAVAITLAWEGEGFTAAGKRNVALERMKEKFPMRFDLQASPEAVRNIRQKVRDELMQEIHWREEWVRTDQILEKMLTEQERVVVTRDSLNHEHAGLQQLVVLNQDDERVVIENDRGEWLMTKIGREGRVNDVEKRARGGEGAQRHIERLKKQLEEWE